MPIPEIPTHEWTEDQVQAARRRGRQVAFEYKKAGSTATLTADDAWDLMEAESTFQQLSDRGRKAMAFEMADACARFAQELAPL